MKKRSPSSPSPDPRAEAFQCALRFLGYRPRSAAEVHNYLIRRGYSTAIVAGTLEKLRSLTYVNDEDFARHWATVKFASRGHGPRRIAQELRSKGIGEELIREVLRAICDPEGETERARLLLAKRFNNQKFTDVKTVRRAVGFLQRRGYSSKVIFDLLRYPAQDD